MNNITKMLIAEKVPGIVCAAACMASVLMGFGLGFLAFGSADENLTYADTTTVYQAGAPYYGAVNYEEYELPEISCVPYAYYETVDTNFDSHMYVVKAVDGYIVIYYSESNGGGVMEFTSIFAGALSMEDQQRLAEGIPVYTNEELVRILQDYGS